MNSFGHNFRLAIFGESHGECIGVVIDGVPAGLKISAEDFAAALDRRRGGRKGTTPRCEADEPNIVSGVYEGHTTGAPLAILFRNENTRSSDYEGFRAVPRPGHADYVAGVKWNGFNDPRGGGHFSGRLTLPLVAAGVIAKKIVPNLSIHACIVEVGGISVGSAESSEAVSVPNSSCAAADNQGGASLDNPQGGNKLPPLVEERIDAAVKDGDSLGGVVECVVENVPAGLGEPFFDSVESLISHAVFSIPGVRGIEFGDGFAAAKMTGSQHNDPLGSQGVGTAMPTKNGAGGINGGITNGAPIVFRVAFKPTSSISKPQTTLNLCTGEQTELKIAGRHDVCFALRTPVIVEAVTAIVLADLRLRSR